MKKTIAWPLTWLCLMLCAQLNAQFLLLDDMEGNGICSGRWAYYAGNTTTAKVQFNVVNPDVTGLNTSSHVAKFTKDTSAFEYMSAYCNLTDSFDLKTNSVFKMLVYCTTKDEIMFKLQPGADHTKAVFFTYKVSQVNRWEEAVFNFQSVSQRTDFNRVNIHFMDGKKGNGILYFDLVQGPNPTGITLSPKTIDMGEEDGEVISVTLNGDVFKDTLTASNWTSSNMPPGVSIGEVQRINDTVAHVILDGNSPANYSRAIWKLFVSGEELVNANSDSYTARGNVVFEGNPDWTMIYSDEFDTDGLPDRSKWTIDPRPKGWINGEQQVYTDSTHDNIRIRDGSLVITGKKDFPNGNTTEPWSSGRLISQGKMDFLYGKVEVRARLPRARGSWPAIWLMPTTSAYGGWPRSGELDIMEHVGNNFGNVLSTVHTQNNNWTNGGHLSGSRTIPDADTVYHVYAMEWSPDSIRFSFDGIQSYTYHNPHTDWKDWPFDQKFHIILNLAIGGGMGGGITEADWPDSMLVDYVRVSQKGLGTPVLDSIMIAPAAVSLLPGKTQQYTAAALDQNGHAIAISPIWSITGAGNTIDSSGKAFVQSSGTVTATATEDSVTRSGNTSVTVRPVNYKAIPDTIEAEAFDNSNACCTETTGDAGGGLNVSYIGKDTWFEYDIDVPDSSAYRISFRVAVNNATSLRVMLDTAELTTLSLPVSGGWQNWITVTTTPIYFGPGQKTIRLVANASGWNFNRLEFIPAENLSLAAIQVTPATNTVMAGDTIQLNAWGYDQDSNYLAISPVPQWWVNGSGAYVSPSGAFHADSSGNFTVTAAASNTISGTAQVQVTPVPVLTRLELTPDTVTVPLGAAHQFTLTGYDQHDSVMTISATWTVTGSGNTISSSGVLTAGSTPGNFQVTASSGALSVTASVALDYTCTVNERYEAESASAYAPGPYLQAGTDVDGGQHFAGLSTGHWFAYNTLNVPVGGRYRISFRVSTTAPAQLKLGHSGQTFGTFSIPNTGGAWKTISDTIVLPALSYTGVHVLSGSPKFNWFSINNCAEAPQVLSRLEIAPDTAWLAPGETGAFSASGFDANDSLMDIPVSVWSITGAGNSVSNGTVTAGNTPGYYTVTAAVDSVTATATLVILDCGVNDVYEAESASNRHPGPYLQNTTDMGGGQNFAGLYTGHWFAYDSLNVPAPGLYNISFRISTTAPAQLRVGHGTQTFGIIQLPNTGGAWQTIRDTITLPALSYTGIHVVSGSFRFNWFSISDCGEPEAPQPEAQSPVRLMEPGHVSGPLAVNWKVYPNPTRGALVIDVPSGAFSELLLTDIAGREIRKWPVELPGRRVTKDVSFLNNGVYFLHLRGARQTFTTKIIKQ